MLRGIVMQNNISLRLDNLIKSANIKGINISENSLTHVSEFVEKYSYLPKPKLVILDNGVFKACYGETPNTHAGIEFKDNWSLLLKSFYKINGKFQTYYHDDIAFDNIEMELKNLPWWNKYIFDIKNGGVQKPIVQVMQTKKSGFFSRFLKG